MYEQHTLKRMKTGTENISLLTIFGQLSILLQTIFYEIYPSHRNMKCYTGISYIILLVWLYTRVNESRIWTYIISNVIH